MLNVPAVWGAAWWDDNRQHCSLKTPVSTASTFSLTEGLQIRFLPVLLFFLLRSTLLKHHQKQKDIVAAPQKLTNAKKVQQTKYLQQEV